MTWARFDDVYDDNRKVKRAWRRHPRAVGLHAMAITYCARHETDGLVDIDWLEEKLPKATERAAVIAVLVDVALFEPVDDEHYRVHDFLDYNPSRAALDAKRTRDAERKKRSASNGNPDGFHAESARNPDGIQTESERTPRLVRAPAGVARPSPSQPDPTRFPPCPPQAGGRKRDQVKRREAVEMWEADRRSFAAEHFPEVHPDAVLNAARMLELRRVEPTVDALRAHLAEAAA